MENTITYRYPKSSDVELLLDYINAISKEQTFIRLQGKQLTLKEEGEYLGNFIEKIANRKAIKIFAFDGSTLVGVADIQMGFGAEKHVGNFGITVKKEYRGKKIGTKLMKKTIDDAKKNIADLEIITLGAFSDNERAIHLYKKFGFKKHGELPNGVIRKNKYYNHINMHLDVKAK